MLESVKKDEEVRQILTTYQALVNKKKEVENQIKVLAKIAQELDQDFFFKTYKFVPKKGFRDIPESLLSLNQGELSRLFRSALGGKSLLKKYNLKLVENTSHSWKSNLTKGGQE